ncbi:phage tail protein [Tessaracoccus sp. SD287]|uniref:phage tail protein n=1 Tax=Tessaracoccus sp. SD287 TaxID=2782008 RepID=UPI001A957717|nr:phage tail protein [Tessaracoccus sp. SD287]MBO1031926.1 phage tail protein [Tessaracoccus sp. SD287]
MSAQPGVRQDPYRAYNFKFEINGTVQGHFVKVEGLGFKLERILYRAGGEHAEVRSVPGRVEYKPVTLRYGLTDSTELLTWLFAAVEGRVQRQNVSIAMLDDSGSREVRRWNLIAAWPCEWDGAPLDALGNELAIESLTLAYDRLELDGAAAPVA